jgi:hypothetical protein
LMSSSASLKRSASLTWSWTSFCSREKISFNFAWFSCDKAWLEDASSLFRKLSHPQRRSKLVMIQFPLEKRFLLN